MRQSKSNFFKTFFQTGINQLKAPRSSKNKTKISLDVESHPTCSSWPDLHNRRNKKSVDKVKMTYGVFIDLQKTFDTVDHSILLKILITMDSEVSLNRQFKLNITRRKPVSVSRTSNKVLFQILFFFFCTLTIFLMLFSFMLKSGSVINLFILLSMLVSNIDKKKRGSVDGKDCPKMFT